MCDEDICKLMGLFVILHCENTAEVHAGNAGEWGTLRSSFFHGIGLGNVEYNTID